MASRIGGGWPGPPVAGETDMPVEHLIDWVRVVRSSSDAGSDSAHVLGHGFKATTSSCVL